MKRTAAVLASATLLLVMNASSAKAENHQEFPGVRGKLVIQSDPQHVWQAIRSLRDDDPEDVKTISHGPDEDVLEETFDDLPVIGKAKCRYKEKYKPYERIDYRMIESDHFKAFEGSWVLTPTESGNRTIVELSSYIDTGLTIPFAHQLTNMATIRNVHRRLEDVKKVVETQHHNTTSKRSLSENSR